MRVLGKAGLNAADKARLRQGELLLGPYAVEGRLGRGGMGAVLAAKDTRLQRPVALKVLPPGASQLSRDRFAREAEATARIESENVVKLFAFETYSGLSFLVLERVLGFSLQRRLAKLGPIPQPEAWLLLRHVTSAMKAAEAKGVLHRDLKPGNLLCVPDQELYKVCDFGLARLSGAATDLTAEGSTTGTPVYMSPEQVRGADLDSRTDMYSLGMTLHEVLTGKVPLSGGSMGQVLMRRLDEDVPSLRETCPLASPSLAELVDTLTRRDREDRPASWTEFEDALLRRSSTGTAPTLSHAEREQLETRELDGADEGEAIALPGAPAPSSDEGTRREPEIGEVLGNYQLLEVLGRGGMGVIYLARKLPGEERCAIKAQIMGGGPDGDRRRQRFRQEVEALRKLSHENVVRVHAFGRKGPYDWFAMDYVEGRDLRELLADAELSLAERLTIFVNLCKAIAHAHERGIVHRDLKPANVLVDAKRSPRVLDFGLAKVLDGGSGLTHTGAFLGTPHYMAPEQFLNPKEADRRVDVFALGVILFEMLTGERPFDGETPGEISYKIMRERPPRPTKLAGHLDASIDPIVLKALEREPDRRYQDVSDLKREVIRYRRGTARKQGWGDRIRAAFGRWYAEHKVGFLVGLLVGLLIYTPVVLALYYLLGQ